MTSIDHLSPDEQQHFIPCACGHFIDMRDLAQVFEHLHMAADTEPRWSYAVRKGEARAYPRKGDALGLN